MDKTPSSEVESGIADYRQESVAPGGISDQPIDTAKNDALGFEPYVDAVASFLTDDSTKPPLTMSIEGEWGSGKSSFMKMLVEKLRGKNKRTIEFNAWRHDKADSLWSAFALQLNRKLAKELAPHRRIWPAVTLFVRRFRFLEGWYDAVRMFALIIVFFASAWFVWIVAYRDGVAQTQAMIESLVKGSETTEAKDKQATSNMNSAPMVSSTETKLQPKSGVESVKWPIGLAGIMAALALVISFLAKFKKLFGNPFSIDLTKYARSPKYEDQISFIEQFHDDFSKIVSSYVKKEERVFVFIDDLDRCEVPKAADLVQGLNLLISDVPNFIFVIGMDRAKVAAALAIKFEKALPYLAPKLKAGTANRFGATAPQQPGGGGTRGDEADKHEEGTLGGLAFGYGFIEKFVQVPFRVPQPVREMERFFQSLSDGGGDIQRSLDKPAEAERQTFALEIKNDSPRVQQIGLALARAFDYNPRRLKQFLNLFRLQAFIAFRTGLFRGENALTLEQLGKFVTLSLRWPLLFSDVAGDRNLLMRLEETAVRQAPTKGSEVFENGENPATSAADEPFSRWTDNNNLEEFFRVGMVEQRTMPLEWSFIGLDIPKLLSVSPAISTTAEHLPPKDVWPENDNLKGEDTSPVFGGPPSFQVSSPREFPQKQPEGEYNIPEQSGKSSPTWKSGKSSVPRKFAVKKKK